MKRIKAYLLASVMPALMIGTFCYDCSFAENILLFFIWTAFILTPFCYLIMFAIRNENEGVKALKQFLENIERLDGYFPKHYGFMMNSVYLVVLVGMGWLFTGFALLVSIFFSNQMKELAKEIENGKH